MRASTNLLPGALVDKSEILMENEPLEIREQIAAGEGPLRAAYLLPRSCWVLQKPLWPPILSCPQLPSRRPREF